MADDPLSPTYETKLELDAYSLSTVVYAARDDGNVLLLKRAEGTALAGQFFLPGGLVDQGEDPWVAAKRELLEEAGLAPTSALTMVGCYPMFVYGRDMLQLSFRCDVGDEVTLSDEHTDMMWVAPSDMAAFLTPEARAAIADGNEQVAALLESIATDLDRYLTLA